VLVMLLAPAGVMGSLRLLWIRLRTRRATGRPSGG
jgi:hypothetical protein